MKHINLSVFLPSILILMLSFGFSFGQQKDPKEIIAAAQEAQGGWDKLYGANDIEFTYDYHYPQADIKDLSTERYIFEDEQSWAKYTVHQVNVIKDQPGDVIQYYDGQQAQVSLEGEEMTDPAAIGGAEFLRRANYFWLVMTHKLLDEGTIHEYTGAETVDGTAYDVVKVTYDSEKTGKPQNDSYILYVNPETKLIDRFFFSLPAMGVNEPVILMELTYEDFDGIKLPTKRLIYQPGEDGTLPEEPSLVQTLSDVKLDNDFTAENMPMK